jgi:UDP-N-acetylglucosamine transferase subunit ALG13
MIFVTIGTQEPFNRLIKAVDDIAIVLNTEIVVQTFHNDYVVKNMKVHNFLSPIEFDKYFNQADLIISHAGMGTIISALVSNKPIIVMPRLLKFDEHRNEHQLATAKRFDALGYIRVAYNEDELKEKLFAMWPDNVKPLHAIGKFASGQLIDSLKNFVALQDRK